MSLKLQAVQTMKTKFERLSALAGYCRTDSIQISINVGGIYGVFYHVRPMLGEEYERMIKALIIEGAAAAEPQIEQEICTLLSRIEEENNLNECSDQSIPT